MKKGGKFFNFWAIFPFFVGKSPALICTDCQIVWQEPQLGPFGEKKCMIQPVGWGQKGLQWMKEAGGEGPEVRGPASSRGESCWEEDRDSEEARRKPASGPRCAKQKAGSRVPGGKAAHLESQEIR